MNPDQYKTIIKNHGDPNMTVSVMMKFLKGFRVEKKDYNPSRYSNISTHYLDTALGFFICVVLACVTHKNVSTT
jgi:hypothetical protein